MYMKENDLKKGAWLYWILSIPVSLMLSFSPAECEPTKHCEVSEDIEVSQMQADELADEEVKALAIAYEHMSDDERMKGVVYEPE